MGYTTTFHGRFELDKPLTWEHERRTAMAGMQRVNGNGRGVEGRPQAPLASATPEDQLKAELFVSRRRELEALFPNDSKAIVARLSAIAVMQYRRLAESAKDPIDIRSLVDSVTHAAQLGLEIVGDQAYLVPYKGKIQLIVGPGGLITLGHREGIAAVAHEVFHGDEFDYDLGRDWVHHKKATSGRRPPNPKDSGYNAELVHRITHVWAKIKRAPMRAGDQPLETLEVLTAEDIAFYRSFSKASTGPWFDNYAGMCRKTGLKRVFAFAPKGYILSVALEEDDHGAFVPQPRTIDIGEPHGPAVTVPAQVTSGDDKGSGQQPSSDRGGQQKQLNPATFSFRFGREQGVPLVEIQDLAFYEKATVAAIDDPKREKWRADNEAILEAIRAEARRRSGELPPGDEPPVDDGYDRGDDPNAY